MDRDLAEVVVHRAQELGADYAEARMEKVERKESMVKNGNPEASGFSKDMGIAIRVLVNGSLGFSSTNRLERESVLGVMEEAIKMASASSRVLKNAITFDPVPAQVVDYSVHQKRKIADTELDDINNTLIQLTKMLPEDVPVLSSYIKLCIEDKIKYFVNSEGSRIGTNIPRIHYFMMFTIRENGNIAQTRKQLGASMGWEYVDVGKLSEITSIDLRATHENMVKGQKAPRGKVDLIIGPDVTGIAAHESCGHPYEADRILGREAAQAGESFVKQEMIGEQIGNRAVTIIDDPTIEHSYGFYKYDDEGVQARPRELMLDGRINEFLHNRESGARMSTSSNGSSRATGYDREAIVRMANTFVKPGDYSLDELVEGISHGVYMNNYMEWNIDDKRYNQRYIGREAYLIENGKIRHPVKAPILEMTTPAFWQAVDAVGKEIEFFAATCGKGEPMQGIPILFGGPHLRLKNITLGGA